MAGSTLMPWKLSLTYLQQMTDDPGDAQAVHTAAQQLIQLWAKHGNTAVPAQTVRKLIETKWPLHACTAVARASQQQPRSSVVFVSVMLVHTFLDACSTHLLAAAGPSQKAAPASSNLRRSVLQQVEASGLLQQLPALMIAAAVELSVQAKDGSFLQYSRLVAAGHLTPPTHYACMIRHHVHQLLQVHAALVELLTTDGAGQPVVLAAKSAAVLQLSLAITRNLSAEVQAHMQQGSAQGAASHANPFDMQAQMLQAFQSVASLMDAMPSIRAGLQQPEQQPQLQALLQAPQLVPCLVLQLTITALALEMKGTDLQATRPDGEHQQSSSGSSSSVRQRHQQEQQAPHTATQSPPGVIPSGECPCCADKVVQTWQLACERHASLTPCHHKLFELLGVDARAVLWAAAAVRWHCKGAGSYAQFLVLYAEHVNPVLPVQQLRAPMTQQRQQLEQSLHLLLAVVLLHQVAALPPTHSSFVELCAVLAQVSYSALGAWDALLLSAADTGSQSPRHPPAAELGQLLSSLCTLSAGMQQQTTVPAIDSAVAAVAGARTAGSAAAAGEQVLQAGWASLFTCVGELLPHSVWAEAVPGPALGARPVLQRGLFAVAGLPEQAVGVMCMFEGFVRRMGAAVVPGQPLPEHVRLFLPRLLNMYVGSEWMGPASTDSLQQPLYVGPLPALARAAGPGSAAQRQLHAMLTSVLKLVVVYDDGEGLAAVHATAAATCAAKLLEDMGAAAASAAGAAARTAEGSSSSSSDGSSSSSSSSSSSLSAQGVVYLGLEEPPLPATPCDALQQLPWAVLLGRCLLLLGQGLQQDMPKLLRVQQEGGGQLTWGQAYLRAMHGPLSLSNVPYCFAASICLLLMLDGDDKLELCVSVLLGWLQDPAVDARLAAAWYGPQHSDVLQQLLQLQAAREAAATSSDQATLSELVQHMQAAGHALACLAVPACCNNPGCCVMAGGTELQLVSGKGCICAGCRTARYCSRSCQRAHWKRHKPVCQALAAAQGGGPGAASSSG